MNMFGMNVFGTNVFGMNMLSIYWCCSGGVFFQRGTVQVKKLLVTDNNVIGIRLIKLSAVSLGF